MIQTWSRDRYPIAYLLQQVTEAQVQAAVLAELKTRGIFALAVDVGAKAMRGRTAGALQRAGRKDLIGAVMAGRTGAGMKGLPDIIGVMPGGRALFIEVKAPEWLVNIWTISQIDGRRKSKQLRPAGKPSPEQLEFLQRAAACGAAAGIVWHPKDLDEIMGIT